MHKGSLLVAMLLFLIWKFEKSLFPLIQLELSSNLLTWNNGILTFKDSIDTWNF